MLEHRFNLLLQTYRRSAWSVCLSVCLSVHVSVCVGHKDEPYKMTKSHRVAVRDGAMSAPKEPQAYVLVWVQIP